MKEKIFVTPPGGVKIRHVGFLDLQEFYIWLQRWLEFYGYFSVPFETYYEIRESPAGKEIHIKWSGTKKINDYFSYNMSIGWLLIAVNKVEMQQGDKKIKIEKGDFEIRLTSFLEKGAEAPNMFRRIYDRFLMRKTIEDHKTKLYEIFYGLHGEIKDYFKQYI